MTCPRRPDPVLPSELVPALIIQLGDALPRIRHCRPTTYRRAPALGVSRVRHAPPTAGRRGRWNAVAETRAGRGRDWIRLRI